MSPPLAPDTYVRHRLDRAKETLEEAKALHSSGHLYGCVNRLYYVCFYALDAVLARRGLSTSKHSGARALFNQHFAKTGLVTKKLATLYNSLFDARMESDYAEPCVLNAAQVAAWLNLAPQFIAAMSALTEPPASPSPPRSAHACQS